LFSSLRFWLVAVLLLAALAGAVLSAINYVDPVRIQYKRLTADSPTTYDEIDPRYLETDPAGLITVHDRASLAAARTRLRDAIWGPGGAGADRRADRVGTATLPGFADAENLERIEELTAQVYRYTAHAYHLVPRRGNGALVVYSHGYAGTFEMHARHLKRLVAAGYGVLAFNYPGYGEGGFPGDYAHQGFLDVEPYPLRILVEPVVMGLNRLLDDGRYQRAHMIGFSAGGWLTSLVAAADPRIATSVPVAGVYPLYLHAGLKRQPPPEHVHPPLNQVAGYLDMFVMAASDPGRAQLQVFNRYDRCCYRNRKGKLYEAAVRDAVAAVGAGGGFEVWIDETHPHHHISDKAMDVVMEVLRKGC